MSFHRFDVLVITALLDELDAVLAFGEGGRAAWMSGEDPDGFPFHHRELQRGDGRVPLRIAAASFDEMGETATAARASALIKHLDPACLAMCGICAGKKQDVSLGDVIIADRVYSYDHGKLVAGRDEGGHRHEHFYHDIKTFNLKDTWRLDAAYFAREPGWADNLAKARPLSRDAQQRWLLRALLAHEQDGAPAPDEHPERETCCPIFADLWDRLRLPQHGLLVQMPGVLSLTEKGKGVAIELKRKYKNALPRDRDFKIHIGAIATGKVVQKDPELFERLENLVRKTLGAEMEAAAIGLIAAQLNRQALIVKAVSDFGDGDKDDVFRAFAARASAEVLLNLLLRTLEPSREDADDSDVEGLPSVRLVPGRESAYPGSDLLSRVHRATELRVQASGATARIRRVVTRPPLGGYLEVSRAQGPFVSMFPVAAVDDVTLAAFEAFLADVDARYRRVDPGMCSTLVHGGASPPAELKSKADAKRVLLQSFSEYQGLIDFGDYQKRQLDRLTQDRIYPPELYIPQRAVFQSDGGEGVETDDALGELSRLLASPLGRFVLVLGDFGTGKTFLLHELARRMSLEGGALVPVLIELRSLEKASKLDALIAQHLALSGMDRLDLPAFRYMLAEGRIALLFDGFDELALRVSYERAAEHFATLIQAAQGEAKVVVTSRTQHFLSDRQAKLSLGEQASNVKGYRRARLQPFNREKIRHFLAKRLESENKAERRFRLLDEVRDLLGLAHNPRMLGFIVDIPEEELLKAKERDKTITSAGLYELLLNRWLVSEFERAHPRGALPGLDVPQRWKAVSALALRLWQRTEPAINILELPEELVAAVKALSSHELDVGVVKHQIGSGTLLVRDEEGNFSFIHQSVMEWLVAKIVAEELKHGGVVALLGVREISLLMADFISGLAGREAAERWARRALVGESMGSMQKNALRMLERLGIEARTGLRLAGLNLSGENLSGRDLRHADLTDANLTEASLVGADLTGAVLVRAKLQRADLSDATLMHADLRDVDMRGARLMGTNAVGAKFAGARLREAKLVGARFDPLALEGCELFGAAGPDQTEARVVPMVSAASPVLSIAFSPDGRLLATCHSGMLSLWDMSTGTERHVLQGHAGNVRCVAFSGDGKTLATADTDFTVRLWDVGTGTEMRVLKGHTGRIRSVAFSPDGKTLASGGDDSTVRLWNVGTGVEIRILKGHAGLVRSVAFSADGKTLASGASDFTVRLWDMDRGTERFVLKGHAGCVRSVAFSADSKTLATGADDNTVLLWAVDAGAESRVLKGHAGRVRSVAFSVDGKTLASGSSDSTVRLWDVETGARRQVLKGHTGQIWSVAFSVDGKTLASGADDFTVRLWEVGTGADRRVLKGQAGSVRSVAFSADNKTLASVANDSTVRLWDVGTGIECRVLKGHIDSVLAVTFSSDGKMLASVANDYTVRIWDVGAGVERRILKGHLDSILCVAFRADGKTLASGAADSMVHLWDVSTGTERRILKGHLDSVLSVAFSADGKTLASGSDDTEVRVWDAKTGAVHHILKGRAGSVWSVAFSPDGRMLASGADDSTVRLWDVATGAVLHVLKGHTGSIRSVAFSSRGKTVATASTDSTVRLWDVGTGTERFVLKGHAGSVWSVAFSTDGKTLASASDDGCVRLWNMDTGECLGVLVSLPEGWVAFTLNGRYRSGGTLGGAFWHAMGLCRFEPGELDPYLPVPLRVSDGELLYRLPD